MTSTLHFVDYGVFAVVIVTSFVIGIYHAFTGSKQSTPGEYLTGDRRMRTLPITMSLLVSFLSGIVVLGTPAEMYTRGTQLYMRTVGYCLSCVLSSVLIVPLFYLLRCTSSFEYLEKRFNSRTTKLLGTISMLVGSVFYMGLLLYTPASAISASTNLPILPSIILVATTTTLYTALGGLRGVVWTDVFQGVVMVSGLIFIVVKGLSLVGGLGEMWRLNQEGGRIKFFDLNPDPTQRLSLWSTVVGGFFSTLTIFGVGQVSVQRYCALPSLKKAQLSVLLNIPCLVVMNSLASLVGMVIYAFYSSTRCDPLSTGAISSSNQLVPFFIVNQLNFPGVPGAFLAVLFSGALSSMSSTLNSCAAVTWQDLLSGHVDKMARKSKMAFKKKMANGKGEINGKMVNGNGSIHTKGVHEKYKMADKTKTTIIKILVLLYGVAALGMAFMARLLGQHVLQASLSFSGVTMGPSLGMFLLGGLFPFANYKGAISGCVISSVFTLWLSIGAFITKPHRLTLPTSVDGCLGNSSSFSHFSSSSSFSPPISTPASAFTNNTLLPSSRGLEHLYEVSFLWYSAIGCLLTILIGVVVSLVCRTKGEGRSKKELMMRFDGSVFGCHGDQKPLVEKEEEEDEERDVSTKL